MSLELASIRKGYILYTRTTSINGVREDKDKIVWIEHAHITLEDIELLHNSEPSAGESIIIGDKLFNVAKHYFAAFYPELSYRLLDEPV